VVWAFGGALAPKDGIEYRKEFDKWQGLTLAHFSVQLEPCLTHKNTLHTLNIP
jgi:hypothetical protein